MFLVFRVAEIGLYSVGDWEVLKDFNRRGRCDYHLILKMW